MAKMEKVLAEVAHRWRIVDGWDVKFYFEFMTAAGEFYACDYRDKWYKDRMLLQNGGSYDVDGCMMGDIVILYLKITDDGYSTVRGWKKANLQCLDANEVLEAVILPPPSLPATN